MLFEKLCYLHLIGQDQGDEVVASTHALIFFGIASIVVQGHELLDGPVQFSIVLSLLHDKRFNFIISLAESPTHFYNLFVGSTKQYRQLD